MTRIYYYCFANRTPTGGNKVTYRHVDTLNRLGLNACILHPKSGFRYTSFDHQPPVVGLDELSLNPDDLVVMPEDAGPAMCLFARGVRKVIFNQGAYNTFRGFSDLKGPLPPYLDPDYLAALVVSEDSFRYVTYAFPGVRCHRIHLCLDYDRFGFVAAPLKQKTIAFMTRKSPGDVLQVLQILRSRRALSGWRLVRIEGVDEPGVARLMETAALYLSFGHQEGCPLSNLEAMARGCRVIGYSGLGGREFFADDRALEIPAGDVIAFARAVEAEARRFEQGCPALIAEMEAGASHVRRTYTAEAEREDLRRFYASLLAEF
jgi:hypothetical protein